MDLKKVTTTLQQEHYNFCKEHKIPFAEVLRDGIQRRMDVISGVLEENIEREREKRLKFQDKLTKTFEVLRQEMSEEQFSALLDKI